MKKPAHITTNKLNLLGGRSSNAHQINASPVTSAIILILHSTQLRTTLGVNVAVLPDVYISTDDLITTEGRPSVLTSVSLPFLERTSHGCLEDGKAASTVVEGIKTRLVHVDEKVLGLVEISGLGEAREGGVAANGLGEGLVTRVGEADGGGCIVDVKLEG
jgi:hypothetical protein